MFLLAPPSPIPAEHQSCPAKTAAGFQKMKKFQKRKKNTKLIKHLRFTWISQE